MFLGLHEMSGIKVLCVGVVSLGVLLGLVPDVFDLDL